jgi:hypothetical protein
MVIYEGVVINVFDWWIFFIYITSCVDGVLLSYNLQVFIDASNWWLVIDE